MEKLFQITFLFFNFAVFMRHGLATKTRMTLKYPNLPASALWIKTCANRLSFFLKLSDYFLILILPTYFILENGVNTIEVDAMFLEIF